MGPFKGSFNGFFHPIMMIALVVIISMNVDMILTADDCHF